MDNQYLKNIKAGMKVEIITHQKRIVLGIVEELASRNEFAEEGIMVRLKNGDVGRVKKIILSEPQKNDKNVEEMNIFLKEGENFNIEFKSEAFWSIVLNPQQLKETKSFEVREYGTRASKVIIAKSIASFLNSEGGNLIIGVKENKEAGKYEIEGIEEDNKRTKQPGSDGYKRAIIDEIIRAFFPPKIFNHLDRYISFEFVNINDKKLCWIKVKRSDDKVFLKINDKDIFVIRVDSENRTLEGEKLVDYCIKKWGNK